jgi:hypothetical protein
MCKWGDDVLVEVTVPARFSYTGKDRVAMKSVDKCIASIVDALNKGGIKTVASCCGHGKRPGNIVLGDGRELIVCQDFATGRAVDAAFPPINK